MSWTSPVRSNELAHHGVLGQKWGVRRYQNKDGTLTRLGKKHYEIAENIVDHKVNVGNERIQNSSDEYERRKSLIGPSRARDLSEAGHAFLSVKRNELMTQEFNKAIKNNSFKLGEDYVIQKVVKEKPIKGFMSDEEFRNRSIKYTNTIGKDSSGKQEMVLTTKGREKYNAMNAKLQKRFEEENRDTIEEVKGYDKASKKELNKLLKGIKDPELRELVEMEYYDGYYD